ncbi:hypothetical protein BVRB_006500 [Beta vulgaris subsp. vulgaris]|uniref:Uncharacterized protein n=2 Tax=Beta vulgaris subsp. vulgaris TaxID=3555 RepID=A0A0J8B3D4_BETVV|nr:hypothetical protein BVRB_006500 [Beta vulgaris subsp. vulgaris]
MKVVKRWESSNELPPLIGPPPPRVEADEGRYNHRSIETLVVVLAVITIVAVIAGIIARVCGGRHLGGSGEHDIEGWVERNCRSCIDGGIPPPPPPPPPPAAAAPAAATEEAKPAATEEEKK